MPKAFKLSITILLIFTGGLAYPHVSSADYKEVLGVSSEESTKVSIPPTVEGPGFILPDSPFFFLDQLKQQVKLLTAVTPERKAKVHADVAGERFAELRFMLAKGDDKNVQKTILGVSDHYQSASREVAKAKFYGRDVAALAKKINDSIKPKQDVLDELGQAGGETGSSAKHVSGSLLEAKVRVEDSLKPADLENEIRDDLTRVARVKAREGSDSATQLEKVVTELNRQASDSAQKSLRTREEALRRAIESKNAQLIQVKSRELEAEKKKIEAKYKVSDAMVLQVKQVVEQAQKTAAAFEAKKPQTQAPAAGTATGTTTGTTTGQGQATPNSAAR